MSGAGHALRVPNELAAFIRKTHPHIRKKIRDSLEELRTEPGSGKALNNELAGLRSFRVGRFRIIYKITGKKLIEVVNIGARDVIYEETARLMAKGQAERLLRPFKK